jgi:hypothetical protein
MVQYYGDQPEQRWRLVAPDDSARFPKRFLVGRQTSHFETISGPVNN